MSAVATIECRCTKTVRTVHYSSPLVLEAIKRSDAWKHQHESGVHTVKSFDHVNHLLELQLLLMSMLWTPVINEALLCTLSPEHHVHAHVLCEQSETSSVRLTLTTRTHTAIKVHGGVSSQPVATICRWHNAKTTGKPHFNPYPDRLAHTFTIYHTRLTVTNTRTFLFDWDYRSVYHTSYAPGLRPIHWYITSGARKIHVSQASIPHPLIEQNTRTLNSNSFQGIWHTTFDNI